MRTAAPLLALLLAAPAAAQSVHVVAPAPGPGVDFTSLAAAVAAAQDGDLVLVRSGTYAGFGLNGKALAITADAGAQVQVHGSLFVVGLAPGEFVSLSGLAVDAGEFSAAVTLQNNAGPVWLDGCTLRGYTVAEATLFDNGTQGLVAQDCASVALSHCTLLGGAALRGEPALLAQDSGVHAYASTLAGGAGHCDAFGVPYCDAAGPALEAHGGTLALQSCALSGGAAAPGLPAATPGGCDALASGAPAVLLGPDADVWAYDVALAAGGATPPCGLPGASVTAGDGQLEQLAGTPFVVRADSPVREQQAASVRVSGQPGDLAGLLAGLAPLPGSPLSAGLLLVGAPSQFALLGRVPAAGELVVVLRAPVLPAAAEGAGWLLQGVRLKGGDGELLGNVQHALVLDAAY